jgi:hypothetical protein
MAATIAPSRNAATVGYSRARSPNPTVRPTSGRNHAPQIALVIPTTTFTRRPTPRPLVIPLLNQPRRIPAKMQATRLSRGIEAPCCRRKRWDAIVSAGRLERCGSPLSKRVRFRDPCGLDQRTHWDNPSLANRYESALLSGAGLRSDGKCAAKVGHDFRGIEERAYPRAKSPKYARNGEALAHLAAETVKPRLPGCGKTLTHQTPCCCLHLTNYRG